ncbi:potassium-transporting ATPase subunit C [Williamsia phyllosphaerae]|uniref:Potassium-transporting ATPase KdpC subunit n=1 Tax=Williamsia phyllosphaerae TaxID=885042 RepID=A0ABQ1V595_9NOCA|nr:potassium-transporting ATPase subunit C [Williamsia phyllosphaerae]GGF39587.1 potassium-transporting ATPase KdpC subunit [Williamsia phyllosphaerae]
MLIIKQVLRQSIVGLAVLVGLTVVLGAAYPAAVWGISRIGSASAEGSTVTDARGCVVGSSLLGVDLTAPAGRPDPYLHSRVVGSADDPFAPGDPSASAASQQGPNSELLAKNIDARRDAIAVREGVAPSAVPVDAVTGSGSGVDPDISEAYAALQVPRLARVNGRSVADVEAIVARHTSDRQLGFLGQARVNVLEVNIDLGLLAPRCG